MIEEKRKHQRLPLQLELQISQLFKQDYELLPEINESIVVKDISQSGLGFFCKHDLPVGYYFDAKIQLPNKHFFTVLKILRSEVEGDGFIIGCEFIGLANILSKSVDDYALELNNTNEQ